MSTSHRPTDHCSVDIETLGTSADALIVSIGAVMFSPFKVGEIGARFYALIDIEDAQRCGGRIDASTVLFWMKQDPALVADTFRHRPPAGIQPIEGAPPVVGLRKALVGLSEWYRGHGGVAVWANAPTFDCAILRSAFRATNVKCPWHWRDERDLRTALRVAFGEERLRLDEAAKSGLPKHHALGDAWEQARMVQAVYERLKPTRKVVEVMAPLVEALDRVREGVVESAGQFEEGTCRAEV